MEILTGKPGDAGWYFDVSPEGDRKKRKAGPFASEQLAKFFAAWFLLGHPSGMTANLYDQETAESIRDYPEEMGWLSLKFNDPTKLTYIGIDDQGRRVGIPWRELRAIVDSGEWISYL